MDSTAIEPVSARWLATLAQDLTDFLHVVVDDPDLDDALREVAVGSVLYGLVPGDVVPDSAGPLGYLDDALALRVALDEVRRRAPARYPQYQARIPELCASLGADLEAFQAFLGDLYEPFRSRVLATGRLEYKGKRPRELLDGAEGAAWLDDEVAELALKLDFKPAALESARRKVASILPTFRQKLAPPRRP